ncbi:MAG: hypothetical protein QOK03_3145, partial [Candidatus Binataceae bacterium]|nr:hypothetical protein [Candidatus Binataceae bacterium]
ETARSRSDGSLAPRTYSPDLIDAVMASAT